MYYILRIKLSLYYWIAVYLMHIALIIKSNSISWKNKKNFFVHFTVHLSCLTRDTSSKVFSRIQLNRNSKDLLKWPWKIRCLNQRDESAFDVDQLESVGKKKKSLSRERSKQTKRLERHLMVHTSRCHMLASQCFPNGRLPPTQASYPGVQLSSGY